MSLTYNQFLQTVRGWWTSIILSGSTVCKWSQICLEDEIELNTDDRWPAMFITPQPWSQKDEDLASYTCRIYLVNKILPDRTDRFVQISYLNEWVQAALQDIPDEFNGLQWPIQVIPIVLWDLQGDGIYIDITVTNQNPCYI
jgi:hypothetical protein